MKLVTYGPAFVAEWVGVDKSTVNQWIAKHPDDFPDPDAEVNTGKAVARGWLPERRQEWIEYAAKRAADPGAALVRLRSDRQWRPPDGEGG